MTKIRLARYGSRHQPHYRIVVTDSRNPRDGCFIEILGSYNPESHHLQLNAERAEYWISVGAQPTNTTISLLTKGGVKHGFTPRRKPVKPVEKPEEAAVTQSEEVAEATEETPAAEEQAETTEAEQA